VALIVSGASLSVKVHRERGRPAPAQVRSLAWLSGSRGPTRVASIAGASSKQLAGMAWVADTAIGFRRFGLPKAAAIAMLNLIIPQSNQR
jgi:hypothetical protein